MPRLMSAADFFAPRGSEPLTVSELNSRIKSVIDPAFRNVCVTGEISNLSIKDHIYFNLKDESSTIRCAIWKSKKGILAFEPQEGLNVICHGNISVYTAGGNYTLSLERITPHGEGSVQQALKKLIERLKKEGLFSPERKKSIPIPPRKIAVVTSLTGAAIRDFLNTMFRRCRRSDILICPVLVQGVEASRDIEAKLALLNSLSPEQKPDLIALIRGGGSVEDLWTFNEERVARAIAASVIPIVSGIGHENDVSLSDMVADLRALTPTDAAVCIFPDDTLYPNRLDQIAKHLDYLLRNKCADLRGSFERIAKASLFADPHERLFGIKKLSFLQTADRLARVADDILNRGNSRLATLTASLDALSPLAVLSRGYSISLDEKGCPIHDVSALSIGQTLRTRVDCGEFISSVVQTFPSDQENAT